MKFVCDNCSTQYLISDDKIGPKGVKVRCKRCGNTIVLRPHAREEALPEQEHDPGPFSSPGVDEDLAAAGQSDDVGQAFDQLVANAELGKQDDSEWDDSEYQATEIFDVNRLKEQLQDEPVLDSADRQIDRVFAAAEGTDVKHNFGSPAVETESWFVAINDEQVGPLTKSDVQKRWTAGELAPTSLAWQQGMDNWTPVSGIEELAFLLDVPQQQKPQAQAAAGGDDVMPQTSEDEWGAFDEKSSELAALVDEENEAPVAQPATPAPAPQGEPQDPWAAMDAETGAASDSKDAPSSSDDTLPPWEREQVESGEVARPDDDFFDSSLDQSADDGEGLFSSEETYSRSGRVLAGPAYLGGGRKKTSVGKKILMWSSVVVLLGLVGGGGWYLLRESNSGSEVADVGGATEVKTSPSKKTDAPKTPASDKTTTKAKKPDSAVGKSPGDTNASSEHAGKKVKTGNGATDSSSAKSSPDGKDDDNIVVAKAKVAAARVKKPTATSDRPRQKPHRPRKTKTTTAAAKPEPKPAASGKDENGLPERLNNSQIKASMGKKLAAFKMCVRHGRERDPDLTGKLVVKFVIEPTGRVGATSVVSKKHEKSFVAGCILHVIKSVRFPKFSGKPITIPGFPFKL